MDLVQHANQQGFDCFVMIGRGLAGDATGRLVDACMYVWIDWWLGPMYVLLLSFHRLDVAEGLAIAVDDDDFSLRVRLSSIVGSSLPRCPHGRCRDGRSCHPLVPAPRQQALRGRVVSGGHHRVQVRRPLPQLGLLSSPLQSASAMAKGPRDPDLPRLAQAVDGAVSISGCFDSMSNSAFYHSREVWQPMLVSSRESMSVMVFMRVHSG